MAMHALTIDKLAQSAKNAINGVLSPLGVEVRQKLQRKDCLSEWAQQAKNAGMDVNDFVEQDQRKPALEELKSMVFPLITSDSIVCELGPGSGVYTRRLNDFVSNGQLHVVDVSHATIQFLQGYLQKRDSLRLHAGSGYSLPFAADAWIDLVFCASTFTGLGLTFFGCYIREFFRVLKPGRYAVFDYFDISTPIGWDLYVRNLARERPIVAYNFYDGEAVKSILMREGFLIKERRETVRGSVFIIAQKPAR